MFKFMKKIKITFCCGSKCVLNDTNNDGVPDSILIETNIEQKKRYEKERNF